MYLPRVQRKDVGFNQWLKCSDDRTCLLTERQLQKYCMGTFRKNT